MALITSRRFDATAAPAGASPPRLPRWPVAVLLAAYPVWWLLGIAELSWVLLAVIMAGYLILRGGIRVPRGFGLWLLFLLCMALSATQLASTGSLTFFLYRGAQYLAATVLFVYIYNGRRELSDRYLTGCASMLWVTTIVGGYLGLILPTVEYRSPLSYVLPDALLSNSLINFMMIRRFAQYDPDAWVPLDPRPSAPYLYTNNWGNAYALLLPLVLIYLFHVRGTRRFWWVLATVPISLVPAIGTMNRGMFIGVGIMIAYIAIRYLLMGRVFVFVVCVVLATGAVAAFTATPLEEVLQNRLENSGTNEGRADVYVETLNDVARSPVFGYGAPRANDNPKLPPVGSHGQFWIVMHSHGVPAMVFFMSWFVAAFVHAARRRDFAGIASAGAILVALVQFTFYGFLPVGLSLLMVSCALGYRGPVGSAREALMPTTASAPGVSAAAAP